MVRLDGEVEEAVAALNSVPQVEHMESHGQQLTVSVTNGASLISDIALALDRYGVQVQELTLRTPTMDDVFLQVTGARLEEGS